MFEVRPELIKRNIKVALKGVTNFFLFLVELDNFLWRLLLRRTKKVKNGILCKALIKIGLRHIKVKFDNLQIHVVGPDALNMALAFTSNYYENQIKDKVKTEGDFVDIGSHIGYYTLKAAKHARIVVSIEPHPENFYWLSKNVKENRLDNTILVNKALSNKVGYASLYLGCLSTWHHLSDKKKGFVLGNSIVVPVTTLDRLLTELGIGDVDLIKMDVQGAEVEVLEGATKTLERVKRLIIEEHGTLEEITVMLSRKGFVCHSENGYIYALKSPSAMIS